jgi:hypothetical protein
MEHVGILKGFVVAFRYTHDDYPLIFAQVEHGGANQIPHIFYKQNTVPRRLQFLQCMQYHVGVEVAAFSGIDLYGFRARSPYAVGVPACVLVSFDHIKINLIFQIRDAAFKKCGFPRPGRTYQIDGKNLQGIEEPAVSLGQQVVFVKDILLQVHHPVLNGGVIMRMVSVIMSVFRVWGLTVGMCPGMDIMVRGMTMDVFPGVAMVRGLTMDMFPGKVMVMGVAMAMGLTVGMISGMDIMLMGLTMDMFPDVAMAMLTVIAINHSIFCHITASAGYTHGFMFITLLFQALYESRGPAIPFPRSLRR